VPTNDVAVLGGVAGRDTMLTDPGGVATAGRAATTLRDPGGVGVAGRGTNNVAPAVPGGVGDGGE